MTITYTQIGDYLLPNLAPSESPKVGRWGMLRFNYLRKHREALYTIIFIWKHFRSTDPAKIPFRLQSHCLQVAAII